MTETVTNEIGHMQNPKFSLSLQASRFGASHYQCVFEGNSLLIFSFGILKIADDFKALSNEEKLAFMKEAMPLII